MENENITREEELLVEHFFTECKTDLPDNGFTRRVMSNLPHKACRYNNIWSVLCLLIAGVSFVLFDGVESVRVFMAHFAENMMNSLSTVHLNAASIQSLSAAALALLLLFVLNAFEKRSIL
jgi:hypothetical protein